MKIENYYMMNNTIKIFKDFPHVHIPGKLKALTKPINWILKKLHAQEVVNLNQPLRIHIDKDKISTMIQRAAYHQRSHGEQINTLIIGPEQYRELVLDSDQITGCIHLSTEEFLGYKVVLSPFIDGFLII